MSDPLAHVDWNRPQPVPKGVARLLRVNFPQISATGIYNDRNIAGTNTKSAHSEGRALDIHLNANDPSQRQIGDRLFSILMVVASETGIDNVIWNRRIWSVRRASEGIRDYTGRSPHTDHIHVEFTREGSQLKVWNMLELEVAKLRTGLEELHEARKNTI